MAVTQHQANSGLCCEGYEGLCSSQFRVAGDPGGGICGLSKTVTRLSNTQIEVNISGDLNQVGYGKICIAGDAFENAFEPGGAVRQVAEVAVIAP